MRKPVAASKAKPAKKPAAAPKKRTTEEKAAFASDTEANEIFQRAAETMADVIDRVTNLRRQNSQIVEMVNDLVFALTVAQREVSVRDGYIAALRGEPVPTGEERLLFVGRGGKIITALPVAEFLSGLIDRHRTLSAATEAVNAKAAEVAARAQAEPINEEESQPRWQPL